MSQHFLLSSRAKTLSLATVFRMSDAEAETTFRKVRWDETDGAPVCPYCGGLDAYECRRPNGSMRFRCRACAKDFSITSGTLFASHKLPLRMYLAAIAIFRYYGASLTEFYGSAPFSPIENRQEVRGER